MSISWSYRAVSRIFFPSKLVERIGYKRLYFYKHCFSLRHLFIQFIVKIFLLRLPRWRLLVILSLCRKAVSCSFSITWLQCCLSHGWSRNLLRSPYKTFLDMRYRALLLADSFPNWISCVFVKPCLSGSRTFSRCFSIKVLVGHLSLWFICCWYHFEQRHCNLIFAILVTFVRSCAPLVS